ncbi:MAG: secondary thiamine-phosphate synthase enzyme [Spirochaetae bacterium HGW-Spirochaetae-6]|nr:MAG: secondary thiamine-phosphate synthase enzyme [Spirochaetae bacterium HGW-Spirochaetae-6]
MVHGEVIKVSTQGFSDIQNITGDVQRVAGSSKIQEGLVNIFVLGSTASISTIEFEPALIEDMQDRLEALIPQDARSRHSETWGDENGFSHMRATLMGPNITVPLSNGEVILGTWQQIVIIDHDNRPRNREIFVQVIGE